NTNKKLGLTMVRLIACIACIPFEESSEPSAFIMNVEKETERPAIIPLPKHDKINIHLSSSLGLSMTSNTLLSSSVSWRADCECNIRDGLLRPSDGAEGGIAASTAC
ncbi:MAG: hypothetical protein P8P91_07365, partial [Pseudomonadales bacterium]|nr:hypothetical protein [Pseudomonadales bacterium]